MIVRGRIDRRILVNYRLDPERAAEALPKPFRPKLVEGQAVGGVCLIRLDEVRPRGLPAWMGIRSENAAHRFAVEWDENGETREGVYIPRRDSDSWINRMAGGRVFPGEHCAARFDVHEDRETFTVAMQSLDGETRVRVDARTTDRLPEDSIFPSLEAVSQFFERGSVGYSATARGDRFEGIELHAHRWAIEPLDVRDVGSSFFDDLARFPKGAATFDCALLMRDIEHEWVAQEPICV